eukprot:10971472-Alexandrium_andersonii.AAC.1
MQHSPNNEQRTECVQRQGLQVQHTLQQPGGCRCSTPRTASSAPSAEKPGDEQRTPYGVAIMYCDP